MNNYRYERKYVIDNLSYFEVESVIKNHPAFFSEIYYERYVRNIYFDTQNFHHYYDNIDGTSERNKFRIRWYGNLCGDIKNSKLEIKYKKGLLGYKKYFDIDIFSINNQLKIIGYNNNLNDLITDKKHDKHDLKHYFPIISNSYKRRYFLSADKLFRITIDFNQFFYRVNGNSLTNRINNDRSIVVELKYDYDSEKKVDKISQFLPFRLSKNSKYVEGVESCYS